MSKEPSPDFVAIWQKSDAAADVGKHTTALTRSSVSERLAGQRSTVWANLSMMAPADQALLMGRLSTNWPYANERRALTWPVHAGLLANCITSSLITTRINAETFLFDAKSSFLESVRKCPKSPFVFGIYSSGVTYYMLHQMIITPKVFNEQTPCGSCLLTHAVCIGLGTGIVLPMLATPYLAHYVMMQREGEKARFPEVKNALEFLTLGWEGSKSARGVLLKVVPLQVAVAAGSAFALLWGRQRMFSSIDADPELAQQAFAEAQMSPGLKQRVVDFLQKLPIISGVIGESPENESY